VQQRRERGEEQELDAGADDDAVALDARLEKQREQQRREEQRTEDKQVRCNERATEEMGVQREEEQQERESLCQRLRGAEQRGQRTRRGRCEAGQYGLPPTGCRRDVRVTCSEERKSECTRLSAWSGRR
jgi:hypothetical protein